MIFRCASMSISLKFPGVCEIFQVHGSGAGWPITNNFLSVGQCNGMAH